MSAALPDLHRSARWLSAAETAALVRRALKTNFPGVKFSVRSHTYAGGASINVRYTDGPLVAAVEAVCKQFEGGRFDGSVDYAYRVESWLSPDGTATIAHNRGSACTGGYDAESFGDPPHPAAELVRFGANFVFVTREWSHETRDAICAPLWARYGFSFVTGAGERGSYAHVNPDQHVILDGSSEIEAMGGAHGGTGYLWQIAHRYFIAQELRHEW